MTKRKPKPEAGDPVRPPSDTRSAALVILVDNVVRACRLVPDEQDVIVERSFNALYTLGFTPDEVTRALKTLVVPPVVQTLDVPERLL